MCDVTRWFPRLSRLELVLTICENLGWEAPNGQRRGNSCLALPPKVSHKPHRPRPRAVEALPPVTIVGRLADERPVTVAPVPPEEQPVWDVTMAAEHGWGSAAPSAPISAAGFTGRSKVDR